MNRRDFVKASAMAAGAGLLFGGQRCNRSPEITGGEAGEAELKRHAFVFMPGATYKVDPDDTSQLLDFSPWFIAKEEESRLGEIISPPVIEARVLEAANDGGAIPPAVLLVGKTDVSEALIDAMSMICAGGQLALETNVFVPAADEKQLWLPPIYDEQGLLPAAKDYSGGYPHIHLLGYKLQYRTGSPHPFGSCVTTSVAHVHFDVFKDLGGGRYNLLCTLHVGTYRSGGSKCYVIYSSPSPYLCLKACTPGQFLNAVYAALAAVLAGVAAYIVSALAYAIEPILLGVLAVI